MVKIGEVCEHQNLKRQCPQCDLLDDIADLNEELKKTKATAEFWQRTSLQQQQLKDKAEKELKLANMAHEHAERDLVRTQAEKAELQEQLELSITVIKQWNENYDSLLRNYKDAVYSLGVVADKGKALETQVSQLVQEQLKLKKDVISAVERYQLLECKYRAAQDEIENGPPERFKMDINGNLTRIVDLDD